MYAFALDSGTVKNTQASHFNFQHFYFYNKAISSMDKGSKPPFKDFR